MTINDRESVLASTTMISDVRLSRYGIDCVFLLPSIIPTVKYFIGDIHE